LFAQWIKGIIYLPTVSLHSPLITPFILKEEGSPGSEVDNNPYYKTVDKKDFLI
jgi:hypothetical protein